MDIWGTLPQGIVKYFFSMESVPEAIAETLEQYFIKDATCVQLLSFIITHDYIWEKLYLGLEDAVDKTNLKRLFYCHVWVSNSAALLLLKWRGLANLI